MSIDHSIVIREVLTVHILGVDTTGISIGTVDIMHEIIRIVGCMLQDRIINIRTGYGDPGIDIRVHRLKLFKLHRDDFALLFCRSLGLCRFRCLHACQHFVDLVLGHGTFCFLSFLHSAIRCALSFGSRIVRRTIIDDMRDSAR